MQYDHGYNCPYNWRYRSGGGMISVLASSAVDRRFELSLARKQDKLSEVEMSIRQYIDEKLMSWC